MCKGPLRVLLMDDEASLRVPLCNLLQRKYHFHVETAENGAQALARIEAMRGDYDAALLDMSAAVPPDGIDVMQGIKTAYPDIECIVMTGWDMHERQRALDHGAYQFVEKPFRNDELAIMLRRAAQQSRLRALVRKMVDERELPRLLERTTQAACDLAGADQAALVLSDPQSGRLDVLARIGHSLPRWTSHLRQGSLTQEILAEGKVFRLADTQTDPRINPAVISSGVRSIVGVPMPGKQGMQGVLYAYSCRPDGFNTWETLDLLQQLARHTAQAVANALAFAEKQRSADRLAALSQMVLDIGQKQDRQELLQALVERGIELMDAWAGAIYLLDPAGEQVRCAACAQLPTNTAEGRALKREGLSALILEHNRPVAIDNYHNWEGRLPDLDDWTLTGAAGAPIRAGMQTMGTFVVYDTTPGRSFAGDLDLLQQIANHAGLALQKVILVEKLHKIQETSALLASLKDPQTMFGQTCQAVVELFDAEHSGLVLFDPDLRGGVVAGEYPPAVGTMRTRVAVHGIPAEEKIVREKAVLIYDDIEDARGELGSIGEMLSGFDIRSILIVPVVYQGRLIGSFSLDAVGHKRRFTREEAELCSVFASHIGPAIENLRLLAEAEAARADLKTSFEASTSLVSAKEPEAVLRDIVERAQAAAGASGTALLLIEELGPVRSLIATGLSLRLRLEEIVRDDGISRQVWRTGQAARIEDAETCGRQVNRRMFSDGIRAGLCLPLLLEGKRIGAMWFHYGEPHEFNNAEVQALQLFVNHAAVAYHNARRMRELSHLHRAAEAMSRPHETREVLQQIVRAARDVLQADSAALWSYDNVRREFMPDEYAADGISEEDARAFGKLAPKEDGTADTVMGRGWVGVQDIADPGTYDFKMGRRTRDLLSSIGARSFQGIALQVGDEKLGVLYVNYNNPHTFGIDERQALENLATPAALALTKARLVQQLARAREAARAVARVTIEQDLKTTLQTIVERAHEILSCDTCILYAYNSEEQRFWEWASVPPPDVLASARRPDRMAETLVAQRMLDPNNPACHFVESDAQDDELLNGAFARAEHVKAAIAIRLSSRGRTTGLLFANYETPRRFTDQDRANATLLADQAAVAIVNAQLYTELQDRADVLQTLHRAGQTVTASLQFDETLRRIMEHAVELTGRRGTAAQRGDIMLVDGDVLCYAAAYPAGHLGMLLAQAEEGMAFRAAGQGGITGRAARMLEPQLVLSPATDPDFCQAHDIDTRSELSVPIVHGSKVLGVLNLEDPEPNAFDSEDAQALALLAAQAAVAIQNARLYSEAEERLAALTALNTAGQIVASTLSFDDILQGIAEQALVLAECRDEPGAFSHLTIRAGNILWFAAASDRQTLEGLRAHLQEMRLDGGPGAGITVRAVLTGHTQNVPDVSGEPAYRCHRPDIRSELTVPIRADNRTIGAINVERRKPGRFSPQVVRAVESLAATAGAAIQNARLYEQAQLLAEISSEAARQLDLQAFLKAVFSRLRDAFARRHIPVLLSVATYDVETRKLITQPTGFYPQHEMPRVVHEADMGIVPWVARIGQPYYAAHVEEDPHYLRVRADTLSEFAVPILFGGDLLGVLDLESSLPEAFAPQERQLAIALADHIAALMRNVQQYEDLKQIKGLVGSMTVLDWVRMVSAQWGHHIKRDVGTARVTGTLVKRSIEQGNVDQALQDLEDLDRLLEGIAAIPIAAPLTADDVVVPLRVNSVITTYANALWGQARYSATELELDLEPDLDERISVRASEAWLRRGLEVLIENAMQAMAAAISQERRLSIATRLNQDRVEIRVRDTGPGIPPELRGKLFREPIRKPQESRGAGVGAAIAGTIFQAYGGDIEIENPNAGATTIRITLPTLPAGSAVVHL